MGNDVVPGIGWVGVVGVGLELAGGVRWINSK